MFLLPCIFLLSFMVALWRTVVRHKPENSLLFFIFGLPIYITALSLSYLYGFSKWIPFLQATKEIIVLAALIILLINRKTKLVLQPLDKLVLAFFLYNFIYILIPVGSFGFFEKLLAFKGLCFFPFIYFTGRLMNPIQVDLNKYFHYICLISIMAAVVLLGEVYHNEHLQIHTGYAVFSERFFGQEASGNYGLSWTFETSNGIKRFASFFSQPLEMGANTLLAISVITALATGYKNKIKPDTFTWFAFAMTLLCIYFAFSRAAFASYFIILYTYAHVTKRTLWLKIFHYGFLVTVIAFLFYISGDVYEFIAGTIDFSDSSSAFHILQWLDGITAIQTSPFGMGLGMSGRVSGEIGANIGGENQLIIIGVQTGLISVGLYIAIYIYTIHLCFTSFRKYKGKIKKLALALLLVKTGMIMPTLTANAESYNYVAYITWFFAGLLVSMQPTPEPKTL